MDQMRDRQVIKVTNLYLTVVKDTILWRTLGFEQIGIAITNTLVQHRQLLILAFLDILFL